MQDYRKRRALLVKSLVDEFYVPESHRGSMLAVYRRKVLPVYPISIPTFYRYMEIAIALQGYIGKGPNRVERCKTLPARRGNDDDYPTLF